MCVSICVVLDHEVKKPNMKELIRLRTKISSCWKEFAVELGVSPDVVVTIDCGHQQFQDKCFYMFHELFKTCNTNWSDVVKALQAVGLTEAAKEVADKYLQGLCFCILFVLHFILWLHWLNHKVPAYDEVANCLNTV